jgi:uncharacterized membrane protein
MFNRSAVKQRTKHMVLEGNPTPWKVTLVFILATTWISQIVDLVLPNPFADVMTNMQQWLLSLSNSSVLTDSSVNAMMQEVFSGLAGGMAMWAILASLIVAFYSMVVGVGYSAFILHRMRGEESGYNDLFSYFYLAAKIIWLEVLKFIFIYLWSLLFIFPGYIAYYRYRMAEYILIDDPDISALEAIRRSKRMMVGRKFELWFIDLTFIGWQILCTVIVNLVSFGGTSLYLPDAVVTILILIADTAVSMFLTAYINLTAASYYLYALTNPAPPMGNGGGPNRNYYDNGQNPDNDAWTRPENPYGDNHRDWNQ